MKKQPRKPTCSCRLMDLAPPESLARKLRGVEAGQDITVLAEQDGKLLGCCSLHHGDARWFRHLGEIGLQVAPKQPSHGLGKVPARTCFDRAGIGVTQDRCPRLGVSASPRPRGFLVLMSYDVSGFHD